MNQWSLNEIRVLHVEDDPDFGDLTAKFLERCDDGLTIDTATNPADALETLAEKDFDCVISDYDMPEMTGIEFLETLRDQYPDLPFILFTGKGSEEVASEAISAGVTDYLQKETGPSQYRVLANRVNNAVEQYRTRLEQQQRLERRNRQWDALLELTTDDAVTSGDFTTAVRRITETAAAVLDVPRVNVWLFDAAMCTLDCVDNYDQATGNHSSEMQLVADNHPAYFDALESNRSIAIPNVREDQRTTELSGYLEEHNIRALLDATIRSEGEVVGVVCHENVGSPRQWSDDEQDFACDIAEVVYRALQNYDGSWFSEPSR